MRATQESYSGDLRRRVVAAALEGGQSREVVARRFAVGRSSVYRWVETAQTEGRLEARPMRGGPRPMIRDETEAALKDMVKSDNHLTLAEYRDRLADRTEVRVHPWTVGRALRRLGLTRKKLERQSWLAVDLPSEVAWRRLVMARTAARPAPDREQVLKTLHQSLPGLRWPAALPLRQPAHGGHARRLGPPAPADPPL